MKLCVCFWDALTWCSTKVEITTMMTMTRMIMTRLWQVRLSTQGPFTSFLLARLLVLLGYGEMFRCSFQLHQQCCELLSWLWRNSNSTERTSPCPTHSTSFNSPKPLWSDMAAFSSSVHQNDVLNDVLKKYVFFKQFTTGNCFFRGNSFMFVCNALSSAPRHALSRPVRRDESGTRDSSRSARCAATSRWTPGA